MSQRLSFYGSTPEDPRDDLLSSYLTVLERRNGSLDIERPFPTREAWMEESEGWTVRSRRRVDPQAFMEGFTGGQTDRGDLALQALLTFVRINAGEAYGVEVVSRLRKPRGHEMVSRVERVLQHEETYHTRILLGATRQFDVPTPTLAWKPGFALRGLIATIAIAPNAIHHPVTLASELAGIFAFNWLLERLPTLFPEEPELRETLEQRLIEILVDEVGHVAYQRMCVGPVGLRVARRMAPEVARSSFPDMAALGWSPATLNEVSRLDLEHLPDEVRRRAFFV
ncbi:MAG TPA: hypothetical protein VK013_16900 [Myxococcaceae bacterium]|nr:hypothetical protein [Myxococcaceae bacterium]